MQASQADTPVVSIHNLAKHFPPHNTALEHIQAEFPKGAIIGLVGPDGAGKTTLLRLIAGLLLPSQGSIQVAGCDTVRDANQLHHLIGYMPQKFGLYEDLTVDQNLQLYADLRAVTGTQRQDNIVRLLHFTGLGPFTSRLAGALSGGMKQKLGLACTLIRKPTVLLLDEPSVGVDPISRRELWRMVTELIHEDISVIWSTAYLDEAEKCDTVLLLHEGRLLYQGSPQAFKKNINGHELSFEDTFITLLGATTNTTSKLAENTSTRHNLHEVVIEAQQLTKQFGNFTAAKDISFQIKRGEIFGLLGPNGAGKSTTFKMMCGLLKPTYGQAYVQDLDLQKAPGQARAHIGYMAQKFSLYGTLSVRQNLSFFAGIYNLSGSHKASIIDTMTDIFNLAPYLDTNAGELPLGFKQRLALACATMHDPEVLFLDEPTSGVDPLIRREFWHHIQGMVSKGVTVMVTTHFMDEAEHCDRIALIYRSQIIKLGSPADLKAASQTPARPQPTLEDAFIQLIEEYDAKNPT